MIDCWRLDDNYRRPRCVGVYYTKSRLRSAVFFRVSLHSTFRNTAECIKPDSLMQPGTTNGEAFTDDLHVF